MRPATRSCASWRRCCARRARRATSSRATAATSSASSSSRPAKRPRSSAPKLCAAASPRSICRRCARPAHARASTSARRSAWRRFRQTRRPRASCWSGPTRRCITASTPAATECRSSEPPVSRSGSIRAPAPGSFARKAKDAPDVPARAALIVQRTDVLPHLKTARFDRPLSYRVPQGMVLAAGDIARVPLGTRDVFAYVLSEPYAGEDDPRLRDVVARIEGPRAFDATGLALARWIAEEYVCSLRDALGAVVLAAAIPRAVERFVPRGDPPDADRFKVVPERLIRLLWTDFRDGVSPDVLLRHPEARRAGDRKTLLRAAAVRADRGAARCDRKARGAARRARVRPAAAARGHRQRQDVRLPARDRARTGRRWPRDRARPGDRADAADRGALRGCVRRPRRRAALRALRARALRRLAGRGARRDRRRRRLAQRRLRTSPRRAAHLCRRG